MRIGWCLVVGLLLADFALAEIWVDGDTVIIEPNSHPHRAKREKTASNEVQPEVVDEDTISVRINKCVTSKGLNGQCMSLRECYPVLFPIDPTIALPLDTTLSDPLAEQLIAASGFCSGGEYNFDSPSLFAQVVRSEVLVCCPAQPKVPPPLPPPAPPSNVSSTPSRNQACGTLKVKLQEDPEQRVGSEQSKIVNGREAKRGEFPWIVALMKSGREFCGGQLVDSQTLLTAAHCVQQMTADDVAKLTIQIGDHDIYSTADGVHEVRTASRILYHRGFSMQHLHHDIALIQLSRPVSPTNYIQPVCLHSGSPSYDNVVGDVAGWGQLRDGGPQPSKLQTAPVRIWSHSECSEKYGSNAPAGIGQGMVCSGGDGRDSCRGDSGGPLTINSRSRAQLVGIVSWGIGCGSYPGVYTRVDQYLPWIDKNRRRGLKNIDKGTK